MRSKDGRWALAALAAWLGAGVVFGMRSPDFGHLRHPVALLGAIGEPGAPAFNLVGFVLPGLLLAWLAWRWRGAASSAGWRVRLGLQLLLLSALGLVAQGLLPLDPTDLDATASRLHALAWSAWWIAFAAGGLLAGVGVGGRAGLVLVLAVVLLAVGGTSLLPAPLAQRLAFAGWFGWWLWAARLREAAVSRAGA